MRRHRAHYDVIVAGGNFYCSIQASFYLGIAFYFNKCHGTFVSGCPSSGHLIVYVLCFPLCLINYYSDVTKASKNNSCSTVCSTAFSASHQRKHQNPASLAQVGAFPTITTVFNAENVTSSCHPRAVLLGIFPDSKVHGAHLGPVGRMWVPCRPHEP